MPTFDEEIGARIAEAAASGELAAAPSWQRPMPDDAGWQQTPEALRLPYKILKDAGVVPYEVELLHRRARLRRAIDACADPALRRELQILASEVEQELALRLDALRRAGDS